ncbi:hypothetical protein GOARA_052_00560 [Gordonia araii NBRC 100433]|uniref:Uncharacterized protein n=1 Tax=Gordonia araii NBRC 100433 TaxID=1073574 RepID=G7H2T2_9ACTN|nr:hypothetical protein [Gordonia araii]NNG98517.1 hypothetical protein [Gordonia araii NBRC 100433]GAB10157.1 hypothetical protein GOARA_052_00560 [Gordonia araii NBRC 100433]
MLGFAIVAALAAFALLVAGLMTGQVWLAIACVVASVVGLVALLIDIRRGARAEPVENAPTTGAFLGEDIDAYVAQREARRDSGTFAGGARTAFPPEGSAVGDEDPRVSDASNPVSTPASGGWLTARPSGALSGFPETEPDYTGPAYPAPPAARAAAGQPPANPYPANPYLGGPNPGQESAAQEPSGQQPSAGGYGQPQAPEPVAQDPRVADPAASGPAFTMPTVSSPPPPPRSSAPQPGDQQQFGSQPPAPPRPGQQPNAPRPGAPRERVGDLHDYVTSTGSIPRIETSGSNPVVVTEPGEVRWESSIPPAGSKLVSDQSREAMRHVNDLPPTPPPTPRRARRPEPRPTNAPVDPLDPNWRPPLD